MKKIINNKLLSVLLIVFIYVIALVGGIFVYKYFVDLDFWLKLLIADIASTIIVFIFSILLKNASVYDPYWSVQPFVIVLAVMINYPINLPIILMFSVITLWAFRLTINWLYTFYNLNYEDWRYKLLKDKTKYFYPIINFIGIHMVPTLVVYLCTLPACYLIINNSSFNVFTILGFIISMLAILLEFFADMQMHRYKKNKKLNKVDSIFIRDGLWKYSRHPNYLGEILMWYGIAFISLSSINDYLFFIGAICNTLLFICVSIPMAENKQSKKEGFSEYKNATRYLLPFKK